VTRQVADRVEGFLRASLRPLPRADLRGKRDSQELFLVRWEQDDTLATLIGSADLRGAEMRAACLELRHGAQLHRLGPRERALVLGRDTSCDLVVAGGSVSRLHARIAVTNGKFKLSDTSANGTFVRFGGGEEFLLSREEIVLDRAGSISLGSPHVLRAALPIAFAVGSDP